jgi:site-specific DNA-methyltransferase (adenine-specific)
MFCNTKFGYELIKSNEKWFRYDLVWDKQRGVSFLMANKMPMKSHEMVYVFSKLGAYYKRIDEDAPGKGKRHDGESQTLRNDNMFGTGMRRSNGADKDKACVKSVITIKKVGTFKNSHPTEKPTELYEWLLSRYCPEGGTVLDPTAGSFNSILVARKLGFRAIGIEMDTNFYWKGVKKLMQTIEPPASCGLEHASS